MKNMILVALLVFSGQPSLAGETDVLAPSVEILRDSGDIVRLTDKIFFELRATDDHAISKLKYEVRKMDNTLLWSGDFGTAQSHDTKVVVSSMGIEASTLGTGSYYIKFTAYDSADNRSSDLHYAVGVTK